MLNNFLGPKKLPYTQYEKKLSPGKFTNIDEGVIEFLFSRIPQKGYCVELGAGDGEHWSYTGYFIKNYGWGALLLEGNPEWAKQHAQIYQNRSEVKVVDTYITAENIVQHFKAAGVPSEFDLLVVDIDGIDYYVWEKLAEYRPSVVAIEYNASFGPRKKFKIDYDPEFVWQEDDYFGASFASLLELGKSKGYGLVHCGRFGDNMIFVKNEYLGLFPEVSPEPQELFQPPQYKKFGRSFNGKGHPLSPRTSSPAQRAFHRLWYYIITPVRKVAYLAAAAQGVRVKDKLF